jgi:hypothetical protein
MKRYVGIPVLVEDSDDGAIAFLQMREARTEGGRYKRAIIGLAQATPPGRPGILH